MITGTGSLNPVSNRYLSGLRIFEQPTDTVELQASVYDMFLDPTFVNDGLLFDRNNNLDTTPLAVNHTEYDQGNPVPSTVALLNFDGVIGTWGCVEANPRLRAIAGGGGVATLASSGLNFLVTDIAEETSGSVSSERLTKEIFSDESVRYDSADQIMEPDGTGSTWDSTLALQAGQAQVMPIPEQDSLEGAQGGCVGYPNRDWTNN